jgi:hypothetical protein
LCVVFWSPFCVWPLAVVLVLSTARFSLFLSLDRCPRSVESLVADKRVGGVVVRVVDPQSPPVGYPSEPLPHVVECNPVHESVLGITLTREGADRLKRKRKKEEVTTTSDHDAKEATASSTHTHTHVQTLQKCTHHSKEHTQGVRLVYTSVRFDLYGFCCCCFVVCYFCV